MDKKILIKRLNETIKTPQKTRFIPLLLTLLLVVMITVPTIVMAAQATVLLGTTSSFAVLAGSGITNTGTTVIKGDVGTFPTGTFTGQESVALTGGTVYLADTIASGAQDDLATAYLDAAGRTPVITIDTELGGTTVTPGIYDSADGTFQITGTLILDGQGQTDPVFIFKTAATLITASGSDIVLENGARDSQIFWQVGSSATLGTHSHFVGHLLAFTSITANTGAIVQGQLLAMNGAVTLDNNTITNEIDTDAPVITLGDINTAPTNQDITVTATTDEGTLNADSHVFTANGSFDFVATDEAGNITTKTVTISNIDKVAPVITLGDINTAPTNQDITVTATTDEGTLNADSHVFTANGSFDFVATDEAGNIAIKTVTISNIDKVVPVITPGEIYTAPTNQDNNVTAITDESTVNVDSPVFTANASSDFVATDAVENVTIEDALISNIDHVVPVITPVEINTDPIYQDTNATATSEESRQLPKAATPLSNVLVLMAGIAVGIGIKSAVVIVPGVLIGGLISNIPNISVGDVKIPDNGDMASNGLGEHIGTITQNNPDGSITKVLPDGTVFTQDAEGIGKLTTPDGNLTKSYPDSP